MEEVGLPYLFVSVFQPDFLDVAVRLLQLVVLARVGRKRNLQGKRGKGGKNEDVQWLKFIEMSARERERRREGACA